MYKLIIICFLILNFSSCKNSKEKKFVSEEASNASFNCQGPKVFPSIFELGS